MAIVYLGSDHAGMVLKAALLKHLSETFPETQFEDLGPQGTSSVDYPDYAQKVSEKVAGHSGARGILVCGSGIGMSIAANKIPGIRAALVWDATSARLSRQHNDANVLCLGERLLGVEVALEAARVWMSTEFLAGRHSRRVELLAKLDG